MSQQSEKEEDYNRHWELKWNTQLGVRYHMHLERFYSRLGKFITAFTLVMSTSAFATIYQTNSDLTKWLVAIAALLQVLELVIDTKSKAKLHASLRQRYLQLEIALSGVEYVTANENSRLQEMRIKIEVDEPPMNSHLMDKCHNELCHIYRLNNNKCKRGLIGVLIAGWYS
ncbi:hypothetical protein ACS86_10195 [Vibrio alginolyticus]|nr:hypothetical protein ACS86_10195 [Vibrio alginolyticus]